MRLAGVANLAGRRWTGFVGATSDAGLGPPVGLPWLDLIEGRSIEALERAEVVRVDSPGEDAEVHGALAGPGCTGDEVAGTARWAMGLARALSRLRPVAGRCTSPPAEVVDLFDKRRTHRRLLAAGVPVAPDLDPHKSAYRPFAPGCALGR